MKTCPNCGSKMEADVNFCTVCGTNIKDVPLDGQQVQPQVERPVQDEPVQPTPTVSQSEQPQEQQSTQQQVPPTVDQTQSAQDTQQQPSATAQAASDAFAKVSTAVKNFDKESLFKWFVTSWKTPSAEQKGEKWYGIVTLLVEIILFTLCFATGVKKWIYSFVATNFGSETISNIQPSDQAKINNFAHDITFDIFLGILIVCLGIVVASYFMNRVVHNDNWTFFDYTNRIVQLSNICSILVVVISVLSLINLQTFHNFVWFLMALVTFIFLVAGAICVREGTVTSKDSFYGVVIYLVAVLVIIFVAFLVIKNQLVSQIQTAFDLNIGKLLNWQEYMR